MVVSGQDGEYSLKNWTENDADLQGEHALKVEAVIARKSVGSLEGSVFANRVTIRTGKHRC
jgi:hypothetical protein